jgi:hypothetical protein
MPLLLVLCFDTEARGRRGPLLLLVVLLPLVLLLPLLPLLPLLIFLFTSLFTQR